MKVLKKYEETKQKAPRTSRDTGKTRQSAVWRGRRNIGQDEACLPGKETYRQPEFVYRTTL